MRYVKGNNRAAGAPTWALRIFLILAGVLVLLSEPVQSQQARRRGAPPPKCPLPDEELSSLITLLDDIEQEPTPESDEESVEEDESEENVESGTPRLAPHCVREIKKLRNAVSNLQRRYYELKQTPGTTDERQYRYMENRYANQKKKLTDQLEELAKQINSQGRTQLRDLRRKIAEVEKQLGVTVNKVAEQRRRNEEHFTQLVATNIGTNSISNAITNFNTLMTYSIDPYGAIVERLSPAESQQKTRAMLTFLQKVDFKHRPVLGYDALVDALIARSALNGPNAIELLKHIQCLILARDGAQQVQALALLKKFKSRAQ